ncbi:MAG: polysaccharide pyruvyl transferase CsaB [Armatimonadota bacterium]
MPRVLLSGYYGFGNVGDEAILQAVVEALTAARDDVEIGVLSATPQETAAAYNVRAFHRAWPTSVLLAIRWADLVLSGGGGLLQDATSPLSPLYYLGVLRLAQALRRKTMVLAQGLGPLTSPRNVRAVKAVFARTQAVTVRDAASAEWLRSMGHVAPEPRVTGDLALLLRPRPTGCIPREARCLSDGSRPAVGLAFRPWRDAPHDLTARLAHLAGRVAAETDAVALLLPFHPSVDLGLCEAVRQRAPDHAIVLREPLRPDEVLALVGRVDAIIGMRLHALIFAAISGTPFLAVSYDPKVDAFVEAVAGTIACTIADFDPDEVVERLRGLWPRRAEAGARLATHARVARCDAERAIQTALSLLE